MAITTKTVHITDQPPARVDHVVKRLTGLSHSNLRGLFDHGCVTVNAQLCAQPSMRVKSGDRVDVNYNPQQSYREKKKWSDRAFTIVYEDPHIIVVNKAAYVLTVATGKSERNTLESRVSHYLQHSSHKRQAFVAHRLDRGVSGLLVFAKSPAVLGQLRDQFRAHKPERIYIALVGGVLRPAAGTFRSFLQTADNLDQVSTLEKGQGRLAVTHYLVQRELPDAAVVEVRLETGRRNQIRVHLAEAGHPVLGDPRYGGTAAHHKRWREKRLALHALSLGLEHPVTGQQLLFTSELPNCMQRFIDRSMT